MGGCSDCFKMLFGNSKISQLMTAVIIIANIFFAIVSVLCVKYFIAAGQVRKEQKGGGSVDFNKKDIGNDRV